MKKKVIFQVETEVSCDSLDDLKKIIKQHVTNGNTIPYNMMSTEFNGYELKFKTVISGEIK